MSIHASTTATAAACEPACREAGLYCVHSFAHPQVLYTRRYVCPSTPRQQRVEEGANHACACHALAASAASDMHKRCSDAEKRPKSSET
jgi:hypothetical protein